MRLMLVPAPCRVHAELLDFRKAAGLPITPEAWTSCADPKRDSVCLSSTPQLLSSKAAVRSNDGRCKNSPISTRTTVQEYEGDEVPESTCEGHVDGSIVRVQIWTSDRSCQY